MKIKLQMRLLLAFAAVLIILSAVSVFSYVTQNNRTETIGWVDHTNEVMTAVDDTVLGLVNAETGFRGYMVTGDESFLEPYYAGVEDYTAALEELKELTSDNPAQVERWSEVSTTTEDWIANWIKPGFEIREAANEAAQSTSNLQAIIAEGRGKSSMDQMRSVLAELEDDMKAKDDLESVVLVGYITEEIINQETGMRGFVVTGEETFLEPFEDGKENFAKHVATLKNRLSGDTTNLALVNQVESLAAQWLEEAADPWIAAQREINEHPTTVKDVEAYVATAGGKQYMDGMRATLAKGRSIEDGLLEERQAADIAAASLGNNAIIFGTLLAIIIGLAIAFFLARSISSPANMIAAGALRLSEGDAELTGLDQKEMEKLIRRQDELGETGQAFTALVEYFTNMTSVAQDIAKGDLTIDVTPKGDKDLLGNAFRQMVVSLRDLVGQVTESAGNLSASSEQLSAAADQAGQATNQITMTIQQVAKGIQQETAAITQTSGSVEDMARAIDGVAKGAQEQAEAVSKSSEITSQLTNAITQVAVNTQSVTEGSAKSSEAARSGSQTVEGAIQGMQAIKEKVDISAQRVQEMGQRSEEIGVIVETINDIASQTNLLALNAAIEAARAGEHGKGFAVVADEVRKLAERSAGATGEIESLVREIQRTVADAVAAMDEGAKEVDAGVSLVNDAGQALSTIIEASETVLQQAEETASASEQMSAASQEMVSSIDGVSAVVEENTAATEEMAASSNEVTSAIEGIASVSEENSAAVEEVSASTEEMSAQVEEVTASSGALAEMAGELTVLVSQFKLGSGQDLRKQMHVFELAHLEWVNKLNKMLEGALHIKEEQAASHTDCIMGRWYYSSGKRDFGEMGEFKSIEEPHIHFHESVRDAVKAQERGDVEAARKHTDKADVLSKELVNNLHLLERKAD